MNGELRGHGKVSKSTRTKRDIASKIEEELARETQPARRGRAKEREMKCIGMWHRLPADVVINSLAGSQCHLISEFQMNTLEEIETARLLLRKPRREDAPLMFETYAQHPL